MSLFAPEDELLGALREEADRTGLPPTAISADAGRFLQVLLRSIGARRVLEVGTLGGYSAIWMARALPPDGIVVTLEREERHAAFARRYVARAGLASAVDVRQGRALDVLPSLDGEEFDVVYLDADRAPIATYFDWAMRLVRLGGMIVAHNVLLGGRVAEQASRTDDDDLARCGPSTRGSLANAASTSILVPAYDGFLVAVVNSR